MLAEALQAEVDAYIAASRPSVMRTGAAWWSATAITSRAEVLTSAGAVEVSAPRVNDKRADPVTGERQRFSSAILPPWARKSPKMTEVLPLLYLHGLSSGDFVPALGQFLGHRRWAVGVGDHPADRAWQGESSVPSGPGSVWRRLRLPVGGWDPLKIRLEEDKLCLLVMIGVRADGRKELVALADGYRESAESWADLLRDCRPPRHARPGAGHRGRCAGVLESAAGGLPRGPGGAAAGSTNGQCPCRAAEVRAPRRELGAWSRSRTPRIWITPSSR